MAREAAETVVLVIDEEGVESLISELLKAASDSQVLFHKLFVGFHGHHITSKVVEVNITIAYMSNLTLKLDNQMD